MKTLTLVALASMIVAPAFAGDLPRSDPESQGVDSAAVLDFVESADATIESMNSFMLVRHGHVVAEGWWAPYSAEAPHSLYSLSKSFTSTAVGLAVAEGKLSLDDPVLKFFPDDAPAEPSRNLRSMRVRDLLRMSTGQQAEPPRPDDRPWTAAFLDQPVPFKPGTHFLYNTSGTYMLSAIVQEATGEKVLDYLGPRLFGPLGIESPTWEESPQGVSAGGYGLSVRTEDIAKFGQLLLQRGEWDGEPLVPAGWVDEATRLQTSNGSNPESDWDQGYGYQFWRCRHGAYRGDGAFGQYCIVLPEEDAVIAITSGVRNMQAVLDLVWDRLLPSLGDAPLPADDPARSALEDRLRSLRLPTVDGSSPPSEVLGRTFTFAENDRGLEAITLESGGDAAETLVLRVKGTNRRIALGRDDWATGRASFLGFDDQPAAASGAWADGTYTARICFTETPFLLTLRLAIDGDRLRLDSETNVGFGPTRRPTLEGKPD